MPVQATAWGPDNKETRKSSFDLSSGDMTCDIVALEMADLHQMHKLVAKTLWFFIFDVAAIIYLIVGGYLHWDVISLVSSGTALALINFVGWLSAPRYKDWK